MTLRTIRTSRKLTQARVAEILGVDRTTYVRLEQGTRRLDVLLLAKLRKDLPLSDQEVLGVVDTPESDAAIEAETTP